LELYCSNIPTILQKCYNIAATLLHGLQSDLEIRIQLILFRKF